MNSLVKLVVFLTVLGVLGAGLFFFPQSPIHHTKIRTIIIEREVATETEQTQETMAPKETDAPVVDDEQVTGDISEELQLNE